MDTIGIVLLVTGVGRSYGLAGTMSAASVSGLQSPGTVAATVKHFAGYAASDSGLDRTPIDTSLREGGDVGKPIVDSDPTAPGAVALTDIANRLAGRGRGLAGMQLGLTPTSKYNADWDFLIFLRDQGRKCAGDWLAENFAKLGVESSVDVGKVYL